MDAAVAAQRELELPVRMGLATGKPSCVTATISELAENALYSSSFGPGGCGWTPTSGECP
jgi:hypothetical protein